MKTLFTLLACAALCGACTSPTSATTDSDELTYEARSAIVIFHDMSAVKTAITTGAGHNTSTKALVSNDIDHVLEFTPGENPEEDAGVWTLSTSETGNYHVIGSVYDRITAGALESNGSLFVPANTYMPSIDQYTSDDAFYSLTPVEHEALGLVALLQ